MVRGIGIDSVDIEEMARLVADGQTAFARRAFTEAERAQALARHTAEGFDFRRVETLEDENGCPHVTLDGPLAPVLAEAGVTELLVSITNERGVATALVLAQ